MTIKESLIKEGFERLIDGEDFYIKLEEFSRFNTMEIALIDGDRLYRTTPTRFVTNKEWLIDKHKAMLERISKRIVE